MELAASRLGPGIDLAKETGRSLLAGLARRQVDEWTLLLSYRFVCGVFELLGNTVDIISETVAFSTAISSLHLGS